MFNPSVYAPRVKVLKREKKYFEAEQLLLRICREMEADPKSIAPWYYEQLAIIYRKQKRYADEVKVLERYWRSVGPRALRLGRIGERLLKLRGMGC